MNVLALCISVKNSGRRDAFVKQSHAFGIPIAFFDAVTVADVRQGFKLEGCILDLSDLGWSGFDLTDPRRKSAPLLFTEIACAYSHIMCWRLAKRRKADYLVIFEDDVIMKSRFSVSDVPSDCDLFYISDRMPRSFNGEAYGYGCGSEGYILTRSGIKKCLDIFTKIYMPVDLQLIAHQRGQVTFGHGLTKFRQKIKKSSLLNAYVSKVLICSHPLLGESLISAR